MQYSRAGTKRGPRSIKFFVQISCTVHAVQSYRAKNPKGLFRARKRVLVVQILLRGRLTSRKARVFPPYFSFSSVGAGTCLTSVSRSCRLSSNPLCIPGQLVSGLGAGPLPLCAFAVCLPPMVPLVAPDGSCLTLRICSSPICPWASL